MTKLLNNVPDECHLWSKPTNKSRNLAGFATKYKVCNCFSPLMGFDFKPQIHGFGRLQHDNIGVYCDLCVRSPHCPLSLGFHGWVRKCSRHHYAQYHIYNRSRGRTEWSQFIPAGPVQTNSKITTSQIRNSTSTQRLYFQTLSCGFLRKMFPTSINWDILPPVSVTLHNVVSGDSQFLAQWNKNCSYVQHSTNESTMVEPGPTSVSPELSWGEYDSKLPTCYLSTPASAAYAFSRKWSPILKVEDGTSVYCNLTGRAYWRIHNTDTKQVLEFPAKGWILPDQSPTCTSYKEDIQAGWDEGSTKLVKNLTLCNVFLQRGT